MTKEREILEAGRQMFKSKYPGNYGYKAGMLKEIRKEGKRTGKYPSIPKLKEYKKVLLSKGLKEYTIEGVKVIALNEKNAIRKYNKLSK